VGTATASKIQVRVEEIADAAAEIAAGLPALGFLEGRLRAVAGQLVQRRTAGAEAGRCAVNKG
jgi:hypothetical protein